MSKGTEKSLIPELRFPEFRDKGEWTKSPLSNFIETLDAGVSVNSGDRPAKSNEFGILKTSAVSYGVFESTENKLVFDDTEISRLKEPVSENSIIISRMNTPALVGANVYINSNFDNLYLPDRLWAAKARENTEMRFIASILSSGKGREMLSGLATGTSGSMKNITKPDVFALQICAPDLTEQQKIADCLFSIDELITAQTQKLEVLKGYKKGLMQQLFPAEGETAPKLRFPEFKGEAEWVRKPFSKLFEIGGGKDHKHLSDGEIPVYGSGGYMRSVNEYLYDGESACIGRKGTINKPIFLEGRFWTVDTLFYTHTFKSCLPKFIYLLFQKINWLKLNEAGGVPSLSKVIINKVEVLIPGVGEQKRIVECIFSIDKLINEQTKKIETLKIHKKGLMQKLFPSVDGVNDAN